MFSFPVSVPHRSPEGIFPVDIMVAIDDLAAVKPIDIDHNYGVESGTLYSCLPSSELIFTDGRKLPVLETAATIHRYLDVYRQIESFYTAMPDPRGIRNAHLRCEKPDAPRLRPLGGTTEGVVVPLFGPRPCATSEASTPD